MEIKEPQFQIVQVSHAALSQKIPKQVRDFLRLDLVQRLLGTRLGGPRQECRNYLCRDLSITHPKLGAAQGEDDIQGCIWQSGGLLSTLALLHFVGSPCVMNGD